MKKALIAIAAAGLLAACGGGKSIQHARANDVTSAVGGAQAAVLFAQGPISRACLSARRDTASRSKCGCVQAVANMRLTGQDQKRGAKFFSDPHLAQVTRQSDNPSHERFWLRWKAYGADAARLCS